MFKRLAGPTGLASLFYSSLLPLTPDVFTNIPAEEYDLLAPLSAKTFVVEDMRKMVCLEPQRFTTALQEAWDGYFEGAHMDFGLIVPFSKKADDGQWKKSKLDKVKEYILRQL